MRITVMLDGVPLFALTMLERLPTTAWPKINATTRVATIQVLFMLLSCRLLEFAIPWDLKTALVTESREHGKLARRVIGKRTMSGGTSPVEGRRLARTSHDRVVM